MKHLLHSFIAVCCFSLISTVAGAQNKSLSNEQALSLVKQNMAAMMMSENDLSNSIISDTYTTADGITMVYLQQAYKDIPVYNKIQSLAFKDGKAVSFTGKRLPKLSLRINEPSGTPKLAPADAISAAAAYLKLSAPTAIVSLGDNNTGYRVLRFGKAGISQEDITVQLMWLPIEGKEEVRLAWQVFIVPLHSSDYWMIRVDALTGNILEKTNLTVSCKWDKSEAVHQHDEICVDEAPATNTVAQQNNLSPLAISSASYRVVAYPTESPIYPGGPHSLVSNPWTMAGGNAATLTWNNDGTTDYALTRGNNVFAHEDRANNNSNAGLTAPSSTAVPNLTFDYTPDFTQVMTQTTNQRFAITNLFYWNNIMHDISYQYGFDEVSGNFQSSNLGRGGAGNDYVQADAQDASGSNNANFGTPPDGSQPRMQMYLFTYGTPGKDGDLDNGVIAHEYTHGISNRLTGGPATATCLENGEQMGEGWSDYFGLMVTTNWATATTADGANRRPIGNYVLNQTTAGNGIRHYPYSTNMAINPLTYTTMASTQGEVHYTGEIWCAMLWDMTWNIIQQDNFINTNFFNSTTPKGNSAAMKLVMEGMRLQPCSPGFIDGRDAILKADTILFGGRYSCAIWTAFARRGLGTNASQGNGNNALDGAPGYLSQNALATAPFSVNKTIVAGNETMTYTTQVNAGKCGSGFSNYVIRDTLPANVTYVSGGSYNAGTRIVTFSPVSLAAGATASYSVTAKVNAGAYFTPVVYLNETVPAASIPAAWTTTSTIAATWGTSTAQTHSGANAFYVANSASISDIRLITANSYTLGANTMLTFWHSFDTDAGYDGGVVEISVNGGTTWTDLGQYMITNRYNGNIDAYYGTPFGYREAFTGNSGGFIKTVVNLSSFAGQTAKFRFRFGSDNGYNGAGWYIDDIDLTSSAYVVTAAGIYDASNQSLSNGTLLTPISSVVLAAKWGDFFAQKKGTSSLLTWTTLQEQNVSNYTVERSADGIHFSPVTTVAAIGNSATPLTYTARDANPIKGMNWYRIVQKDMNGRTDLSVMRSLSFADFGSTVSISPNPAKDLIMISVPGNTELLRISIVNSLGQLVKNFIVANDNTSYSVADLSAGVYYVRIAGAKETTVKKLVIR